MSVGPGPGSTRESPETFFAPAARASKEKLVELTRLVVESPIVKTVLEAAQGYLMILNRERQVLAANQELLQALQHPDPACIAGLRPGEVLGCIHVAEGPGGCGTSVRCRTCGAVLAILGSQKRIQPVNDECRLSMRRAGRLAAVDFRVRATPLEIEGHDLLALVFLDVSALKRKEVFERTFFHDFLNDIAGIEVWGEVLGRERPDAAAGKILAITSHLKEEILFQRDLLEAESGDLPVELRPCHARDVLDRLQTVFRFHKVMEGRHLRVLPAPDDARLLTDPSLLLRVMVNMVKNALEATSAGGCVRVWFERQGQLPGFRVHNDAVIPPQDRLRIFERSFSTKGMGRGIGTFSMKLFGEGYLRGKVSFTSGEKEGTCFSIVLPEV